MAEHLLELRAHAFVLRDEARTFQLKAQAGEAVCEHVVHLARDSSTLGDRRRLELALACVFELGRRDLCALAVVFGAPVDPGYREQERSEQDRAADRERGGR